MKTHRKTNTRLYGVWCNIKTRCYNPNCYEYANYGGRGIVMCPEWKNDFQTFWDWAYANGYDEKAGFMECTIDRIDVNGNYEPDNCRWATREVQGNNTRSNHCLTYNGETHTIAEWARILGVDYHALYSRVDGGWTIEEIMTLPFDKKNNILLRKPIGMYHKRKRVYCEETNKEYISCKDAAIELGLPINSVAKVARGERNHVHHYHFRFVDEGKK